MAAYNYCSQCGNKLDAGAQPPHCPKCGITYYRNPKPCASVLPVSGGKVLLAKRGRDPLKGDYDIIGGFLEVNEAPEAGALREALEETGLDMKIISLLGMYTDQYGKNGDYTLNLHYIAEVTGGNMKAQDDITHLEWIDIDKVPLNQGFQNTRDGLRDLQKWYSRNKKI